MMVMGEAFRASAERVREVVDTAAQTAVGPYPRDGVSALRGYHQDAE